MYEHTQSFGSFQLKSLSSHHVAHGTGTGKMAASGIEKLD
jgi:hypothetical protein